MDSRSVQLPCGIVRAGKAGNFMTRLQKLRHNGGADPTTRTGDEYAHLNSSTT
jgi:hypothetical protein